MSGIERTVLALRMKPIFEARALAKKQEGVNQYSSLSPNSDEATPDIFTGEVQPVAPVKAHLQEYVAKDQNDTLAALTSTSKPICRRTDILPTLAEGCAHVNVKAHLQAFGQFIVRTQR